MDLEELKECFESCDSNGDGTIQFQEFEALLQNLGFEMEHEACRIGFRELDTDRDGVIDFDEFLAWWSER
ncbi:MAG: EF-hand domain-containing protein [Pseudomonadales bacterium]|jgi:Ca2+-binding EF-hand superfamily protein